MKALSISFWFLVLFVWLWYMVDLVRGTSLPLAAQFGGGLLVILYILETILKKALDNE